MAAPQPHIFKGVLIAMSDREDIMDDEALSAEYVLRLLDAEAERHFETRLAVEPQLRAFVAFWEQEFSSLTDDLLEETPSAQTKTKLLDRLNSTEPKQRFNWGWFAFPALTAIAVVAFLLISPALRGPAFDPTLHATLKSADGSLHIEAGYAPNGNLFKVIPELGKPAVGRDFELWVIGATAEAPVSLGVISADGESLFEITSEIAALIDGGILAVSDEPKGGSPTGAPTGTILATGNFFDAKLFTRG